MTQTQTSSDLRSTLSTKASKLSTQWTKHCKDEKDKEYYTTAILSSKVALSVLYSIVEAKLHALEREEVKPESFDQASWPYRQAYNLGNRKALLEILELTKFAT